MELWIRSQDKMNLVRIKQINVNYGDNRQIIANYMPEEYESISEASRQTRITITSISYSANGKRKTGGGYIWHFE